MNTQWRRAYANCGSSEECTFERVMEVVRLVFIGLMLLKEREKPWGRAARSVTIVATDGGFLP
jgi:hypothetical protein